MKIIILVEFTTILFISTFVSYIMINNYSPKSYRKS